MTNIQKLDYILSSKNVKENFYSEYKNKNFRVWLDSILPEIENAKKCEQRTPWHIYNVLDHTLVAVEEMNKLTKDFSSYDKKLLSYVMFLHDMGKPEYRKQIEVNGKVFDSFVNHRIGSEKIAKKVLPQLNFNEKEVQLMSYLVFNHDLFIGVAKQPKNNRQVKLSSELIENLVETFASMGDGEKILEQLILIGMADNKAQNPDLTKESLEVLEEAKKMLEQLKQSKSIENI